MGGGGKARKHLLILLQLMIFGKRKISAKWLITNTLKLSISVNSECYDDYAILESARAKELHDSLQNVVTLRPNKSEQHARI